MGGECSRNGTDGKIIQCYGGGNMRERDHLKNLGVDAM
jgi:hypothetical protein